MKRCSMNSMTTRIILLLLVATALSALSSRMRADTGTCGGASITLPFTDVAASNVFFCSIAEAYFSGLTNGTGGGLYSPSANVPREQMAAFVTRTMDQSVKRSSKRAALRQLWTIQGASNLALTDIGTNPRLVESDGADLWAADNNGTVSRVRASDGKLLGTWTGATAAYGILVAMGKVFVVGGTNPGKLYQIDPTQLPGAVTTVTNALPFGAQSIAFDGQRIWITTRNNSVIIVTLDPLSVTTVTTGFVSTNGCIYDGANIWVTDLNDTLKQLDSAGVILRTVSFPPGSAPGHPAFDGTNIWVPNQGSDSISVVRASGGLAGTVLATLMGNGLNGPLQAAFDGERILVINQFGHSVSLWKASDLTPLGTFSVGINAIEPQGVCSDGLNFWLTLYDTGNNTGKLGRF